jgi:hypothetical protein
MKRILSIEIISSVLIFLYVYTAISKLSSRIAFEKTLARLPMISNLSVFLSFAIPLAELLIVLLLLFRLSRQLGLYLSLTALIVFTLYLSYIISSPGHLPCSCGGIISQLSWKGHVVFNLTFILLNIIALRVYKKNITLINKQYSL